MRIKEKLKRFRALSGRNEGFTLVELIVVIAILGILAGVAVPAYTGYITKANEAADNQLLAAVNTAFAAAGIEHGYDLKDSKQVNSANAKLRLNDDKQLDYGQSMLINEAVESSFATYFGDGVFKYFDRFNFVNGAFVGGNFEAITKALQAAMDGTNFTDRDELDRVMTAFDQAGFYFSGNAPNMEEGFSLDKLVATAPVAVQEAFGFGTFDLTDVQLDAYLAQYAPGYAALDADGRKAWRENEDNKEKINTIRGNAYVMHIANDANGRNAATVKNDVTNFLNVLNTPVSEEDIKTYYRTLNGLAADAEVNIVEAKEALQLGDGIIQAETVVAMATSGVMNTSGISTLGSMYALAAGYYNSGSYSGGTVSPEKFADFDTVVRIMSDSGFQTYLTNGDAEKDIGAYLGAMTYLSQSELDMGQGSLFSGDGLSALMSALGSN